MIYRIQKIYRIKTEEDGEEIDAVKMIMDKLHSLHTKQDKVYLTNIIPTSLTLCLILFCVDTWDA